MVETYYARIIVKLELSGMEQLWRYAIRRPEPSSDKRQQAGTT